MDEDEVSEISTLAVMPNGNQIEDPGGKNELMQINTPESELQEENFDPNGTKMNGAVIATVQKESDGSDFCITGDAATTVEGDSNSPVDNEEIVLMETDALTNGSSAITTSITPSQSSNSAANDGIESVVEVDAIISPLNDPSKSMVPSTTENVINQMNAENEVIPEKAVTDTPPEQTAAATDIHSTHISTQSLSDAVAIPNPGTILEWLGQFISARSNSTEMLTLIRPSVNFYCQSNNLTSVARYALKTEPTKYIFMYCLKALLEHYYLSPTVDEDISNATQTRIQTLLKLKILVCLYSQDLSNMRYNVQGFFFLLNTTLSDLNDDPALEFEEMQLLDENNCCWDQLSENAKCVVIAAKVWFGITLQEQLSKLIPLTQTLVRVSNSNCGIKNSNGPQGVSEWFSLRCIVLRLKRLSSNMPVVKPKKVEMDALRKAIDLDSWHANPNVWLLTLQILWDWMRTDDRKPRIEIWKGKDLEDVDDIAQLLHTELLEFLGRPNLLPVLRLNLYSLASSFYNYKNLPQLLTLKTGMVTVPPNENISGVEDIQRYYNVVTRTDAQNMAACYLKHGLAISSKSPDLSIIKALQFLKKFCRDDALRTLAQALEQSPWHMNVIQVYLRILVGSTEAHQEEATGLIDKYLRISKTNKWSILFRVHLYFLQGSIHWLRDRTQLRKCVEVWIQGLYLHETHFLNQFAFWSRTQVRKYMWPESFSNFGMIADLKKALYLLSNISNDTCADPRIPSACKAFLTELDSCFPMTWKMTTEIAELCSKWYYLLEKNDASSSSSEVEDEADDEIIVLPQPKDDEEIMEIQVVKTSGPTSQPRKRLTPSEEYMDLDLPASLLPSDDPDESFEIDEPLEKFPVPSTNSEAPTTNSIHLKIKKDFYIEPLSKIPQLAAASFSNIPPVTLPVTLPENGPEVITLD